MELADRAAHPLDGLDSHPWSTFSHAYGSAEDLPDVLRALAGADAEAAREALSELYGSVLHQGTVYSASAEAVPFLAAIAVAGHRTEDVLTLLGGMAESEDEHGVAPGAVRAAVAGQLPLLLPLLGAAAPRVRQAAAWAVSHTRVTAALPALRGRWEEEADPLVRAEVLTGMSRLDPALGAATAATVLDPAAPAELRLAAVLACLDAAVPWTGTHRAAMLSLLPADPLVADRLDLDRNEPLAAVVDLLLGRDRDADREAAVDLLDTALRDGRAEVRAEALWAADRACMLSRSAPRRLVPALVAAAADDEAVVAVASLLGRLGTAAAPAAPVLVPLAGRNPGEDDDLADRVLAALVRVAPDEGAPLLARGLGRRPRALDAAAGFPSPADAAFPYDDELLHAVRQRLARPEALSGNEPWQLTNLLAGWGVRAAPALPQLYAALPRFPGQAARAIASVAGECAPDERARAATALRSAAESGSLPAAKGLYDLTGEPGLLLDLLERDLRQGSRALPEAARTAGALGPRASTLVPVLRAALSGADSDATTPVLDADTALAEALWRVTGDAATVVGILDSVFARAAQSLWSQWSVVRAARVAALLGAAGRPLVRRLEPLLDNPVQVPAATLALVAAAEPGSLDRTALAAAVLDAAEREADPLGACDALEALGADGLTGDHTRRLASLADGDARVVRSGVEDRIIRQDEAFRVRVGALLRARTRSGGETR
ncbi:HEAT repeat domain-containing protein [Streptomyces sp. DH24]|uniref:HEAT repeat domain-containing protein n=1 Tax=Streptomyces sp. DH24 TaxID=3040123 RepID=UPI0024420C8D|nr:HEAT repeat domain-containing protein [Streptomyces sp. DH24]MDG9715446.1 HEAT repeat domain-containing protein [Streptomyces sp. DH24]